MKVLARAWGIARSMVMYHGLPGRHRRMTRFYAQFLKAGDVGFDIGAHVGSRVRPWRRLGVRVIAVEPQPDFAKVLKVLFGRSPDVVIVPQAIGSRAGKAQLAVSSATPTVSSMSAEWIGAVTEDRSFAKVKWDKAVEVDVVTLDQLIARYGRPAFCKIDVEGFEIEVLKGLSQPLPALSFEYLPPAHDQALAALELVERLGGYVYNYCPIETMRFASEQWLDAAGLIRLLEQRFRPLGRSGDVYARALPTG